MGQATALTCSRFERRVDSGGAVRETHVPAVRSRIEFGQKMEITKPAVAIVAFLSTVAVAACSTVGIQPHATSTTLTTEQNHKLSKRIPQSVFSLEDSVVCFVDFQWADVTRPSGWRNVEWRWYRDGALVSRSERRIAFDRTPYTTWTMRAATSLGTGHFTVSTSLDGAVMSSSEFDIK